MHGLKKRNNNNLRTWSISPVLKATLDSLINRSDKMSKAKRILLKKKNSLLSNNRQELVPLFMIPLKVT